MWKGFPASRALRRVSKAERCAERGCVEFDGAGEGVACGGIGGEIEGQRGGIALRGFDDLDDEVVGGGGGLWELETGGQFRPQLGLVSRELIVGDAADKPVPEGSGVVHDGDGREVLPPLASPDLITGGDETGQAFEDLLVALETGKEAVADEFAEAVEAVLVGVLHLSADEAPAGEGDQETRGKNTGGQYTVAATDDRNPRECRRWNGGHLLERLQPMERGPRAGVRRRIYRGYWSWLDLFPGGGTGI